MQTKNTPQNGGAHSNTSKHTGQTVHAHTELYPHTHGPVHNGHFINSQIQGVGMQHKQDRTCKHTHRRQPALPQATLSKQGI